MNVCDFLYNSFFFVLEAGLEPARPFRGKGF